MYNYILVLFFSALQYFMYYKKKDLKELTKQEVKLARNEIYIRHGRRFTRDMTVKKYFEGKDWYQATVDEVSDSQLNKYEIVNRDLIVAYEKISESATFSPSDTLYW